jgi:cell fate (sporulation/competence/biofilm development) regulator YlbF (YheA/YmcA/DUF963 family)
MTTATAQSPIQLKLQELCETILSQPEFESIRQRVDAFMADDASKALYQKVVEQGDALHQKQQSGEKIDDGTVSTFEKDREALFGNTVAKGFLEAQEEIHNITQSVNKTVAKTFELGRVPTDSDTNEESCGTGCGCH